MTDSGRVTTSITTRVKPGHEAAFEHLLDGMAAAASRFAGYEGVEIYRPTGNGNEYRIVYRFDADRSLRRWLNSQERESWLERGRIHFAAPMETQFLTGLESWFTLPSQQGQPPPAPYKMALLTWVTIFPIITVVVLLTTPWLAAVTVIPRLALTTAITVPLMTWVFMPRVTRIFAAWLYPDRLSGRT
jgi:antibiotic biosynthesis monooxygenase (ABM) superfamily enzyme